MAAVGKGDEVRLRQVLVAGCVFLGGFLVTAAVIQRIQPGQDGTLDPAALRATTAVVLVVSPNCEACNDPALPGAWQALLEGLSGHGREPYRVGLVTSTLDGDGVAFLQRFGEFHEVLAGGGDEGVGAGHYISRDLRGPASFPQVVLLERDFTGGSEGDSPIERVVQRRVGITEIRRLGDQLLRTAEPQDPELGLPIR